MLSPNDRLLRVHPNLAASFASQSDVVRSAVKNIGSSMLMTPERGAMPMFWAADGVHGHESTILTDGQLRAPIGSYKYADKNGVMKETSPKPATKERIVGGILGEVDWSQTRLTVLDEVQHGGTMTHLANILERYAKKPSGSKLGKISIIATKDNAGKVHDVSTTTKFKQLSSGDNRLFDTTVVPMPLIGTDRDALLNTVFSDRSGRVDVQPEPTFTIEDNVEAERIFRVLGALARSRDYFDSVDITKEFFEGVDSRKVEPWVDTFVETLTGLYETKAE